TVHYSVPGTERVSVGSVDASRSVTANLTPTTTSSNPATSNRSGMRVMVQSSSLHATKRNPPPPPPPRSGSWLAGNTSTIEMSACDPSTVIHSVTPFELQQHSNNNINNQVTTTVYQRNASTPFVRQPIQSYQPQSASVTGVHGNVVNVNAHPDASRVSETQWSSMTYPIYANGHRGVPGSENVPVGGTTVQHSLGILNDNSDTEIIESWCNRAQLYLHAYI
ncbi:unnamed protein product, partial [Echinostoma caproni]|uniref:HIPK3 n=1 Tax=Echinostoma caproni TaxID=27848 RepID=A0A183ASL7_9TREM